MAIKLAVILSDLHFGSTVGLWPDSFISQEGIPIGQNDFQKWLWECWCDLHENELPKYIGNDPYALILNGDIIEGIHHGTMQVMTANPTDQISASKQVLKIALKGSTSRFMVKGTEVHTRDREISLGEALNCELDQSTGQHAFDKLRLKIHDCPCVFRHHMPATIRPYLEATALSTELGTERIEAARSNHPIPKVLCMAHRHRHGIFRDVNGLVCVTSGWQGLTRHGFKVVGASVPAPSCIVLDWRGKDLGELPHAEDFVYVAKAPEYLSL